MRKLVTWGSYCVWLALTILTILFILYYTIFTRDIGTIRIFKGPFWELRDHMWKDISLNILLFVPFGVMIGWKFGLKGVVAGFFISVMIEAIQYRWALGYTEVDDVINNTIGTGIGCCIETVCRYWLKRVNQD
ncbi:MAG: VanZ family protein [Lachnospiraceae bacterium]|nr:VanZ family protein [Lachnospiraceae bacterium]